MGGVDHAGLADEKGADTTLFLAGIEHPRHEPCAIGRFRPVVTCRGGTPCAYADFNALRRAAALTVDT